LARLRGGRPQWQASARAASVAPLIRALKKHAVVRRGLGIVMDNDAHY
jgi:hypothetical protein